MDYFQLNEVHLMVWEENPKKRAKSQIKVNAKGSITLQAGDNIFTGSPKQPTGCYTIDEIVETRPSSLTGFNYVTCNITWTKLANN